jgi:hypothetical protein
VCAVAIVAAVALGSSEGLSADDSPLQSTPTVTLTPALPPPAPSATPVSPTPVPPGVNVCPQIVNKVPASAISAAIANPRRVSGYNQPLDPGKPVGMFNPPRMWLSIHSYHKPFHPLFNSLEFKIGCP